jgi:transposase
MRTKRKFTPEYIREAVRLVLQENLSTPEAARRLEMSDKTLSNWVRRARRGQPVSGLPENGSGKAVTVSELEMELSKLRAEVARLKMEKDVLKNVWSAPKVQGHSFWSVRPVLRQCIRPVDEAHMASGLDGIRAHRSS